MMSDVKFKLAQYIVVIDDEGEMCEEVLKTIITFPSHPNINSNDFENQLKSRYTDIILYENEKWTNNKYFNKYYYLLKNKNIKKIKLKFYLEKN